MAGPYGWGFVIFSFYLLVNFKKWFDRNIPCQRVTVGMVFIRFLAIRKMTLAIQYKSFIK